jgi:hypothetical protein
MRKQAVPGVSEPTAIPQKVPADKRPAAEYRVLPPKTACFRRHPRSGPFLDSVLAGCFLTMPPESSLSTLGRTKLLIPA